jgi:hypothetical protein
MSPRFVTIRRGARGDRRVRWIMRARSKFRTCKGSGAVTKDEELLAEDFVIYGCCYHKLGPNGEKVRISQEAMYLDRGGRPC